MSRHKLAGEDNKGFDAGGRSLSLGKSTEIALEEKGDKQVGEKLMFTFS